MSTPITVAITASLDGLVKGLGDATAAVKQSTDQMSATFGGLGKMVDGIKAPFLALSAALGGGALFKSAINEAIAWNEQARKVATQLGTTTEQASSLAMALDDIGVSTDQYTGLAQAMTARLASGGEGFKKLGLATRDSSGRLKDTTVLMSEAIAKLNSLQDGTERNAAGALLFGKGWGEVNDILRLTPERMAEAEAKARKLGLLVGPEGAAQTLAYKEALNDVGDVVKSLQVQLGNALLPTLTKVGGWLAAEGSTGARTFETAIKGITKAIVALKTGLEVIVSEILAVVYTVFEALKGIGVAVARLAQGDFAGAGDAMKGIADGVSTAWEHTGKEIVSSIDSAIDKYTELDAKAKASTTPAQRPASTPLRLEKADKNDQVQQWRQTLNELRELATMQGREMGTEAELAFWEGKLATAKRGSAEYRAALGEVVQARKEVLRETEKLEKEADDKRRKALEKYRDEQKKLYEEQLREVEGYVGAFVGSFERAFNTIVEKMMSASLTMKDIGTAMTTALTEGIRSMVSHAISELGKWLVKFIATKVVEGTVTEQVEQQKSNAAVAGAIKTSAARAVEGGVGAGAQVAASSPIGWMIAIPIALGVIGGLMALTQKISSAAGGYDIPAGLNPLVQAHAREMILPAHIADPLREQLAEGGMGQGGTHITIHAFDSADVVKTLKALVRDGRLQL